MIYGTDVQITIIYWFFIEQELARKEVSDLIQKTYYKSVQILIVGNWGKISTFCPGDFDFNGINPEDIR